MVNVWYYDYDNVQYYCLVGEFDKKGNVLKAKQPVWIDGGM